MQVYMICETIDLGYHVVVVHANQDMANRACKALNDEYRRKMVKDLVDHCNYTQERAEAYVRGDQYFIEEHEVLE